MKELFMLRELKGDFFSYSRPGLYQKNEETISQRDLHRVRYIASLLL